MAVEAFKLEETAKAVLLLRPLSPVMTLERGEYRSRVTQGIQQIALTKLVGGAGGALIARLAAFRWGPRRTGLTVPYFTAAFNRSRRVRRVD